MILRKKGIFWRNFVMWEIYLENYLQAFFFLLFALFFLWESSKYKGDFSHLKKNSHKLWIQKFESQWWWDWLEIWFLWTSLSVLKFYQNIPIGFLLNWSWIKLDKFCNEFSIRALVRWGQIKVHLWHTRWLPYCANWVWQCVVFFDFESL